MNHFRISALLFTILTPIAYAIDIVQADIPLTITAPGTYVVQENLTYGQSGKAIIINSSNVILDFNGFSLTLSNHEATGILANEISDFTIENDQIINNSSKKQQGNGIKIEKSKQGIISNSHTIHNRNGMHIKKSHNIQVQDSSFSHALHEGVLVSESSDIAFDNCVFAHNDNGLTLDGDNKNCSLSNSAFPSSKSSNLLVKQVKGMMVENCTFINKDGSSTKPNLVQFGDANPKDACYDVTFRNCIIINRPHTPKLSNTSPEGLGLYQGSGFLVDSCVIDIDNTNQDPAADLSGIHISNPGLGVNGTIASNVIITNCVIQGPATDGLYPDVGSSNVLIENCLVTGAQKDGIFLAGTTASTVVGNTVVNNGTNGIFLGEVSSSNAVNNNVVSNNGFNPIVSSIPPFGNGISIASDSSFNSIQGNAVFSNAVYGINDAGTHNRIFDNNAYNNTTSNYTAATDTIIISAPGAATLTGANISS